MGGSVSWRLPGAGAGIIAPGGQPFPVSCSDPAGPVTYRSTLQDRTDEADDGIFIEDADHVDSVLDLAVVDPSPRVDRGQLGRLAQQKSSLGEHVCFGLEEGASFGSLSRS